jgi:large conductance mechanosensitive channel
MSLLNEFKKFATRGNLIDMAVGFTVGAAFSTIAKTLVDDIIMPPVGLLIGRADFSDLFILLKAGDKVPPPYPTLSAAQAAGAVTVNYGHFLNSVMAFLLVAVSMFFIIRAVNKVDEELQSRFAGKTSSAQEPANKKCCYCLSTIPYHATRCAYCSSDLPQDPGAEKQSV